MDKKVNDFIQWMSSTYNLVVLDHNYNHKCGWLYITYRPCVEGSNMRYSIIVQINNPIKEVKRQFDFDFSQIWLSMARRSK